MSQGNVERVIGRLVTDEEFRQRFVRDPVSAIEEMVAGGMELTCVEMRALASINQRLVQRIADSLDPRLQKIGPCRGRP